MLASARHSDVICLYVMSKSPDADNPLKKEMVILTDKIRLIVTSETGLIQGFNALLPIIFNFRIQALRWLIETDLDFQNLLDDAIKEIEKIGKDLRFEKLVEKILFALNCNRQVFEALMDTGSLNKSNLNFSEIQFPNITYEQFFTTLSLNAPDESVQKLMNWINSSLYIEIISISMWIIHEENFKVSPGSINEMTILVENAGREYLQGAIDNGLVKLSSIDSATLTEDQILTLGIQNLQSSSHAFDFLNDDEVTYNLSDLKEVYRG